RLDRRRRRLSHRDLGGRRRVRRRGHAGDTASHVAGRSRARRRGEPGAGAPGIGPVRRARGPGARRRRRDAGAAHAGPALGRPRVRGDRRADPVRRGEGVGGALGRVAHGDVGGRGRVRRVAHPHHADRDDAGAARAGRPRQRRGRRAREVRRAAARGADRGRHDARGRAAARRRRCGRGRTMTGGRGTVEAALAELAAGRPVLVADDADRENEADVVLAARTATARWVAWAVRHSSGYLCAPLPAHRADALALPLMVEHGQDPRGTAYTVAVDAAAGVTTGISAADRARTLRVLGDPASRAADLIRPGHVLPLRARPGGVLERAGHTEAAVDLVRLAGAVPGAPDLGEVGAIAELVRDDGETMRLPEAEELARETGLVLLTVAELVAWRRAADPAPA